MSKLDNSVWRIKTALIIYYTATWGNMMVWVVGLIVTIGFFASGNLLVQLLGGFLFVMYNIRNYMLGKTFMINVIAGALKSKVEQKEVEKLLENPNEFAYELQRLHDTGKDA